MKLKIGKHIFSTTITILGLLVLTNAVALADAYTARQLENCVKKRMYRCGITHPLTYNRSYREGNDCPSHGDLEQVMEAEAALEICKEAFRSPETPQRRQSYPSFAPFGERQYRDNSF